MYFLKRIYTALRAKHARNNHQPHYFLKITSTESNISDIRKMLIQKLNQLGFYARQLTVFRLPDGSFCLSVLLSLAAGLRQSFIQMATGLSQHQDISQIQWGLRRNKPRAQN